MTESATHHHRHMLLMALPKIAVLWPLRDLLVPPLFPIVPDTRSRDQDVARLTPELPQGELAPIDVEMSLPDIIDT